MTEKQLKNFQEQSRIEIPDYILNPYMPMPTVAVDGEEYAGVLKIPGLLLVLPVLNECDAKTLPEQANV